MYSFVGAEALILLRNVWLIRRPRVPGQLSDNDGWEVRQTDRNPAFKSCPGHDIWKRDFTGSASVFSFTFVDNVSSKQVETFINALHIFKIGLSWGGVTSLAVVYPDLVRPNKDFGGRLVRLNIGLEAVDDLINDLELAISNIN
mgnify:CR=1 FL=1